MVERLRRQIFSRRFLKKYIVVSGFLKDRRSDRFLSICINFEHFVQLVCIDISALAGMLLKRCIRYRPIFSRRFSREKCPTLTVASFFLFLSRRFSSEKSPTITVASFFSRRFSREKCPTLTVASFFSSDYNLTLIGNGC